MVGRPANDSGSGHRQRALVKEQTDHGDLVQFDFVDTYWNLTLKGVGAMQWLNDYCASTRSATLPIIPGAPVSSLPKNFAIFLQP